MAVDCSELAALVYKLSQYHAKQPGVNSVPALSKVLKDTHELTFEGTQLSHLLAEASAARARDLSKSLRQFPAIMREAKGNVKAEESLRKLEQDLKTLSEGGTLPPAATRAKPAKTPARAVVDTRIKEVRDAIKNSPPKRAERLQKKIDRLEAQLKRNDFATPVPEEVSPKTKEILKLDAKLRDLQKKISQEVERAKPKTVKDWIAEGSLLYKLSKAGGDLSGAGVQGGFVLLTQPEQALKGIQAGLEGLQSEEAAAKAMRDIEDRDNFVWYKTGAEKLRLGDWEGPRSAQDEQYMGTLVRTLSEGAIAKGGKAAEAALVVPQKIAQVYHSTGRANTVLLNRLRADMFDHLAESAFGGDLNAERASAINTLVNTLTGGASLPFGAEKVAAELNHLLFSPRLMWSQFQQAATVWPKIIVGEALNTAGVKTNILGGHELRVEAGKIYARGIANAATIMLMATAAGLDVDAEPRSGTFGDVILPGGWHLNVLGPMRSAVVVLSRGLPFVSGIAKGDGIIAPVRGPGTRLPDRLETKHVQYLKSKRAPGFGLIQDLYYKTDYRGKDTTYAAILGEGIVPLLGKNTTEAVSETSNIGFAAAAATVKWFGGGLNHYDIQEELPKSKAPKFAY